ncbi:hypothetical protein H4Q26_009886 [Puccinia striiformis f. sp. tritici PST-130]|nr:hypothetical protein H4Q26_009886 [Puccinia striiformis f. sp. tritici PST-130]
MFSYSTNDWPSSSPIIVAHDQSIHHFQPLEVQLGGLEAQFPRHSIHIILFWGGGFLIVGLDRSKRKNQLSFIDIANHIGRSETWTAGLFYGKNEPTSTDLEKLSELFKLPAQSINDPTPPRSTISLDSSPSLSPVIEEILRLPTSEDQIVSACGWIKTIRKQKNVSFVELIDGSTPQHLQVVIGPKDSEELETGCAIRVTGKLVSSRGDRQAKELKASSSGFLAKDPSSTRPYSTDQRLMRIRSTMFHEASSFLQAHHFFRSETPIITFNDCEAFLTVSAQLHLEALSASLGRVYSFGPTFRAEKSQTNRHLAEFWMLEAEISFIDNLETLMNVLESLLKSVIRNLHQSDNLSSQDLDSLGAPQQPYDSTATSWPRITYTEAVKLIQSHHKEHLSGKTTLPPIIWGQPLASEHEKWLAGSYAQGPIFVTDYPASFKPFYMRQTNLSSDSSLQGPTAACFDLLVPGVGELVGGSLRESNLNKLHENIIQKGMMSDGLALNGEDHKFNDKESILSLATDYQAGNVSVGANLVIFMSGPYAHFFPLPVWSVMSLSSLSDDSVERSLLFSSSGDNTVRVWDTNQFGNALYVVKPPSIAVDGFTSSACLSPNQQSNRSLHHKFFDSMSQSELLKAARRRERNNSQSPHLNAISPELGTDFQSKLRDPLENACSVDGNQKDDGGEILFIDHKIRLPMPTLSSCTQHSFPQSSEDLGAVLTLAAYGSTLYSGYQDGVIKIWDLDTLTCIRTLFHRGSTDQTTPARKIRMMWQEALVTGGSDNCIKIWDVYHTEASVPRVVTDDPDIKDPAGTAMAFQDRMFRHLSQFVLTGRLAMKNIVKNVDKPLLRTHDWRRVLYYGHYDVVQAGDEKDWTAPAFVMTGHNGWLYGRGVTDNKLPRFHRLTRRLICFSAVLSPLSLVDRAHIGRRLRSYRSARPEIIGRRRSHAGRRRGGGRNAGFQKAVKEIKSSLVISMSCWSGKLTLPAAFLSERSLNILSTSLSNSYWLDDELPVTSSQPDLHSDGKICLDGFYKGVRPIDAEEQKHYDRIVEHISNVANIELLKHSPITSIRENLIAKFSFPASAQSAVSIRIVPDQSVEKIGSSLVSFLTEAFKHLNSSNALEVKINQTADWWLGHPQDLHSVALAEFNAKAIHLPMGSASDSAHLPNERIKMVNLEVSTVLHHIHPYGKEL